MSNARSFSTGIIANAPSGRCMWDSFFPVGVVQTAYNVLSESWRMSCYVRVEASFWNHRKTLRLRAAIGDAALWVPPKLWCYAATNQVNGDFSRYSAQELAYAIGYQDDAEVLLKALIASGFMDKGPKLHDWKEYNGVHQMFAERASKAAKARWNKTSPIRTGEESTVQEIASNAYGESSNASSNASSMNGDNEEEYKW